MVNTAMRKRYKVVLNVEITDPEKPFPSGGDYMHLNRLDGCIRKVLWNIWVGDDATVTLDKVIDKGEVQEGERCNYPVQ